MSWRESIKVAPILAVAAFCLYEFTIHRQSETFREYATAVTALQGMLLVCLAIWCGTFLFLSFGWNDWPLVILQMTAVGWYFFGQAQHGANALVLMFGATFGKGVCCALMADGKWKREDGKNSLECVPSHPPLVTFMVGLVGLLALAAWWHLEPTGAYRGPRWMGLWDNPNTYGMLMGAGMVLAIGLLATKKAESGKRKAETNQLIAEVGMRKSECGEGDDCSLRPHNLVSSRPTSSGLQPPSPAPASEGTSPCWARRGGNFLRFFAAIKSAIGDWQSAMLLIAAGMLGVGLVMSYSRGAWVATSIGLLYLVWCYGKLKWRYIVIGSGVLVLASGVFWGRTVDSAPWYVKRADLGRPSAQNRATAWRAGLEIMRDHPLGVGWNNAVRLYGDKYHPPEGGPAALTTNDYLMLGTELGIPALLCFVVYVGLCYRHSPRMQKLQVRSQNKCSAGQPPAGEEALHLTLRADLEFVRGTSSGLAEPRLGRPPSPQSGEGHLPTGSADSADAEREKRSSTAPEAMSLVTSHTSHLRESEALRAACLAGALVFVVAFWFDGGLFKLPTAAMFWVLLELGAYRAPKVESERLRVESPKMA